MPTPHLYLTDELYLRLVTDADHAMLAEWIEADPDHRGRSTVEFFSRPAEICYLLMDDDGPVFFLKLTPATRMDVQFAPGFAMRPRTRHGLHVGFPALARLLAQQGVAEAIFQTNNPVLRRSMERRTGFRASEGELVCSLAEVAHVRW